MVEPFIDRAGVLEPANELRLELGSGAKRTPPGVVGIDRLDLPAVDVVGDVMDVLRSLPDGSVAEVTSHHVLEHVEDLPMLLRELGRVMRSAATMMATVPHWSNPYFYSDPTHRSFFGLYSFSYLARCDLFRRGVPDYGDKPPLRVTAVKMGFRSEIDRNGVRRIKRGVERWVNRSSRNQEVYEAHLARFASCYELRFTLERI